MKKKQSDFQKQLISNWIIEKKILFACLVASIMIIASTPIVFAATEDSVIISFNPDGDIDIDVNLSSYNFTSVLSKAWSNTTGNTFTLYNNGTVVMNTEIKTNLTTDEGDMSLNLSTAAPTQDQYAIYVKGLNNMDQYVNSSYALYGYYSINLNPQDNDVFDICLFLGNLSANYSYQTTTIYFQGSQA